MTLSSALKDVKAARAELHRSIYWPAASKQQGSNHLWLADQALVAAIAVLESQPTATTWTVPNTIAHDSTDVTSDLNAWIDGLPSGVADVSFGGLTFRAEGTILVDGKSDLRFRDGSFWASTAGDSHRAHWRATGGANLSWLDITVTGPRVAHADFDSARQWQHGLDLEGVTGFDVDGLTVIGCLGDGISHGSGTSNGHIHSTCHLNGTGRQSISFTNAQNIQIDGLLVEDPTLSIIDIEPNGSGNTVHNITVDGMRVQNTSPAHTFSLLYAADFVAGGTVSNITVKNCVETGNNVVIVVTPTSPNRYAYITATNNTSDTVDGRAYATLEHIDHLVFSGNGIPGGQVTEIDCT